MDSVCLSLTANCMKLGKGEEQDKGFDAGVATWESLRSYGSQECLGSHASE
jgi:hypothetical protein